MNLAVINPQAVNGVFISLFSQLTLSWRAFAPNVEDTPPAIFSEVLKTTG